MASRILLADEVGLGKTIQAGLIVAELQARGAADRVLILAPASLRDQWHAELRDRFGIDAVVTDVHEARRRAAQLPVGANPWSTLPLAIVSLDYAKRPEVLPALRDCRWDAVIVDEAHGVTPATDRQAAVDALCGSAAYVLLLTATPHSGDRVAFQSLCDLGRRGGDALLLLRRTRLAAHVGVTRRIHRLLVHMSPDERRMHALLDRFARVIRSEGGGTDRLLPLEILRKRALSSPRSLELSSARRLSSLSPDDTDASHQYELPFDTGDERDSRDEAPSWTSAGLWDQRRERELLQEISEAARSAADRETKLAALRRLVARLDRLGESAIVFTEYRDTLQHVRAGLGRACAILHGGSTAVDRRTALEDFRKGRCRLLLATDAAGEGLNLHDACRVVINLELPWNPVRLEQRIGRVDRIGQRRPVHVFHLIARGTGEIRVLRRLKDRVERARDDVAAADPLGADDDALKSARALLSNSAPVADPDVSRLPEAADAEHRRVVQARRWLSSCQGPWRTTEPTSPCASFARRRATRLALSSRGALVLLQTEGEDGHGRTVARHLTSLFIAIDDRFQPPARRAVEVIQSALAQLRIERIDSAWAGWLQDTLEAHERFWTTRQGREDAVQAGNAAAGSVPLQAGLFDRRWLLDQHNAADREASVAADADRLRAYVRRAAIFRIKPPALALILFP
jgi:superfamily II DNA or RNA helicase